MTCERRGKKGLVWEIELSRLTHQPIREWLDGAGDGEPEDAVAEEAGDGADEEDGPGGQAVGDEAW